MDEKYPLALPKGTILAGQFILESVLGQGGFGITYKAVDHKTGEKVAVKEFFPDTMATRQGDSTVSPHSGERGESFIYGKECFLKEAQTLASFIGNENIVKIRTYFEENGTAYFVMDFVEGVSFDEYIKNNGGRVDYPTAERILLPVIDALSVVHQKGIVHRDVTPDNIFITSDGTVKLLDFGAARYSLGDKSRSLDVVLKHGFAPKEQYTRHGKQGPFTDIYSVGASFYFAITGRRPMDSIDRIEEDDLIPPSRLGADLPFEKEEAILTALAVQPGDRFKSMEAFKKALVGGDAPVRQPVNPAPVQQPVQQISAQQLAQQAHQDVQPIPAAPQVYPQQPAPVPAYDGQQIPVMAPQPSAEQKQQAYGEQGMQMQPAVPQKKSKKGLIIGLACGVGGTLVVVLAILLAIGLKGAGTSGKKADGDDEKAPHHVAAEEPSSAPDVSSDAITADIDEEPVPEPEPEPVPDDTDTPAADDKPKIAFNYVNVNNISNGGRYVGDDDYVYAGHSMQLLWWSKYGDEIVLDKCDGIIDYMSETASEIVYLRDGIPYAVPKDGSGEPYKLPYFSIEVEALWADDYGYVWCEDRDTGYALFCHNFSGGDGSTGITIDSPNAVTIMGDLIFYKYTYDSVDTVYYQKLSDFGGLDKQYELMDLYEGDEIGYMVNDGKYLYFSYKNDSKSQTGIYAVDVQDLSDPKYKSWIFSALDSKGYYDSGLNVYDGKLYIALSNSDDGSDDKAFLRYVNTSEIWSESLPNHDIYESVGKVLDEVCLWPQNKTIHFYCMSSDKQQFFYDEIDMP